MIDASDIVDIVDGGILQCPVIVETRKWKPVSDNNVST